MLHLATFYYVKGILRFEAALLGDQKSSHLAYWLILQGTKTSLDLGKKTRSRSVPVYQPDLTPALFPAFPKVSTDTRLQGRCHDTALLFCWAYWRERILWFPSGVPVGWMAIWKGKNLQGSWGRKLTIVIHHLTGMILQVANRGSLFGPLCQFFGSELLLGSTGSVKALETEGKWGCCLLCFFHSLKKMFFLCEAIGLSRRALEGEKLEFLRDEKKQQGSTGSIGIEWPHFANMFSWFFYKHFMGWTKLFHH